MVQLLGFFCFLFTKFPSSALNADASVLNKVQYCDKEMEHKAVKKVGTLYFSPF